MCTKSMIDWNEFYEALDEEKREHRRNICFCTDARPIAEDVFAVEKRGEKLSAPKKIIVNMILDQAARNPDLIFENELNAYAYLLNYMVTAEHSIPERWVPLLEYLVEAGV